MRREKSERSEMVSQLLFGEVYEVLEEEDKWLNIRLLHDNCCGWIDRKAYKEVGGEFVEKYQSSDQLIMSEVFNLVAKKGDWENKMIMAGSVLPFYDAYARTLMIGDEEYIVKGFLREVGIESLRELLIQYALMFYNAPYRWGGRTPNGVDWCKWYIVWRELRSRGILINKPGQGKFCLFWKKRSRGILLSLVILPVLLLMSVSCGNRDELSMPREKSGWIKLITTAFSMKI